MLENGPVFAWGVLYLDPGSGSFIIQLLLGAGMGVLVGAKLYWSKLKSLISRGRSEAVKPRDDEE